MEPLKNRFSPTYLDKLGEALSRYTKGFEGKKFKAAVLNAPWGELELMDRIKKIAATMRDFLPSDFEEACTIIAKANANFDYGFEQIFFPMYVSDNGLKDWNTSMKTLEKITEYSTAEFAIRTFILADEKKAMKQMTTWSKHKNYHVRRLASEGCRPRLPWGTALKEFKKDPAPILPILHNLVHDSEEYVRRSVANNLNDIGKDNKPDLLAFVQQYIAEKETNTQRLLKHACRSFLKAGDPDFLPFFGYENIKGSKILALKHDKKVRLEGELTFEFELLLPKAAKMRIEYAIDYMKSNGSQNRKVFMLSDSEKEKGSHKFKSKQSFKTLSTRKHYPGMHGLHIIVNGSVMASGEFEVQP